MLKPLDPFRFVLIAVAGWMNQHRRQVIDYLREENRVLREQLGGRRLRLSDEQRRRLAAKAKVLGRRILAEVATFVTPETLLAWHRKPHKYDGSVRRQPGRPRTPEEIEALVVRMAQENREWGYERIQGALSNSGAYHRPHHHRRDPATARHGAGTGAQPQNHLEGIPQPALATDRGRRLLQHRGVDPWVEC